MRELTDVPRPDDALDKFVRDLLGAGAVLSQIISQMVRHAAAGGQTPDTVPIPLAAHELLMEVLAEFGHRYRRRDLKSAARLLRDATDRICEEVYFIPPEELERLALEAEGELGAESE